MPPEEIKTTPATNPPTVDPGKSAPVTEVRKEPESPAMKELLEKIDKREAAKKEAAGGKPPEKTPESKTEPPATATVPPEALQSLLTKYELPGNSIEELALKFKGLETEVAKKEAQLGKHGSDLEFLKLIQKHYPQKYDELVLMAKAASRGVKLQPDIRAPQPEEKPSSERVPQKFKDIFKDEDTGEFSNAKLEATMDYFKWLMGELGFVSTDKLEERDKAKERKQLEEKSDQDFNSVIETWSKRMKDEANIDFDKVVYPEMQKLVVALKLPPDTLIDGAMGAELINMALLKVPGGYEFLAKVKNSTSKDPSKKDLKPHEVAAIPGGGGKPAGVTVKDVKDMTAAEVLEQRIKPYLKTGKEDFEKDRLLKGFRR
jgi:hypothetical protein